MPFFARIISSIQVFSILVWHRTILGKKVNVEYDEAVEPRA